MSKIELEYLRVAVNRAGTTLLSSDSEEDILKAKLILDNWRACHVAPLNSFQTSLRLSLKKIDENAIQKLIRSTKTTSRAKLKILAQCGALR